tara:strand:- start:9268 stop:11733 length:2466 start_codon:yes stop_codon:yes gene_type:complete
MASNIRFKRSSVAGKRPTSVQLPTGEIAMNTNDGILWMQDENSRILNVRAGAALTSGKYIYVSTFGDDTNNDGTTPDRAYKTIKGALGIATDGDTIEVAPGTYVENNPVVVPPLVAIQGEDLRSTVIVPQNVNQDLFHVNNGVHITNFSFTGAASTGAVISFDPNNVGVVTQSPYVRNCTNFIPNSIGMRIDGSLRMGNNGVNGSMVVDSYTQYNLNGIGVSITDKAYAQLVSIFTINSGTSIFCGTGGQCDITNSNSSFGEFGLVADNISPVQYTGVTTTASGISSDRIQIKLDNVKGFEIVGFDYDPVTGYSTVTTSEAHNLAVGYGATISGIGFTCPVSYGATHSISGFIYDSTSGLATVTTSTDHGLIAGNNFKLAGLAFTCPGGSGITTTVFPDGTQGYMFKVSTKVSDTSFTANVGASGITHTYTSGTGIVRTGINTDIFPDPNIQPGKSGFVFDVRAVGTTTTFNIHAGISSIPHTFVQAGIRTVNNFVYDHTTGLSTVTVTKPHFLKVGDHVKLDSVGFTCSSPHAGVTTTIFPDGSSAYGTVFEVTGITSTTYTIDIGISTIAHTYDSGGTSRRAAVVKQYANRPYDGQVVYLDQLYNQVDKIDVLSPGDGFTATPTVTISAPEGPNGTTATAEATVENGQIKEITVTNNGSQYINNPTVTITGGGESVGASVTTGMRPLYYTVQEATQPDPYTGISTVVFDQVLNNAVGVGSTAYFSQVSLVLASSHSFEWIGSGGDVAGSRPRLGGVGIQSAETVARDGGIVVYTSTDQSGNFRIGNDVNINQVTGTISGRAFNQSLLNTVTPLIIALED